MTTHWFDANPYLNYYQLRPGVYAYHTGSDLNLNFPSWDADRFKPVHAVAHGVVTHAGVLQGSWGNVVVIRHTEVDGSVHYSRYAHLDTIIISKDDIVFRGQQIGTVGRPPGNPPGPYHLHFDLVYTHVLETNPGHWPGTNKQAVLDNYVNPKLFIQERRP